MLAGRNGESERLLCVFATELGWFSICGFGQTVCGVTIGDSSPSAAAARARRAAANAGRKGVRESAACGDAQFIGGDANLAIVECDWFPELRERLQGFAAGAVSADDFGDIAIDPGTTSVFRRRVIAAARAIPYGETRTYGELAAAAGSPRAARAVGGVMRTNPLPIIVPCHRVVGAAGRLIGFSAPGGVDLKRRLLALEQTTVALLRD